MSEYIHFAFENSLPPVAENGSTIRSRKRETVARHASETKRGEARRDEAGRARSWKNSKHETKTRSTLAAIRPKHWRRRRGLGDGWLGLKNRGGEVERRVAHVSVAWKRGQRSRTHTNSVQLLWEG